uniref:Leukemia inhibitory factor n=1 Tax=Terrapene triunguis TaxID=2587831 RepID=A0A674IE70_9SAUR
PCRSETIIGRCLSKRVSFTGHVTVAQATPSISPMVAGIVSVYFYFQLTHQGLLTSDLRRLCDEAVQWFPTENITDQPKVVMLQELYRTLVHMKDALENIGKQQQVLSTPGAALLDKLQSTQWAVRGLLSNTGCALCLEGVSPNSRHTPERPAATNAFQQKIDGCKVLRNWQKFLEKLARGSGKKALQALRDQRKRRKGTKRKEGSPRS